MANPAVRECLRRTLAGERWLSPPALYLLRDLASGLRDGVSDADSRRAAADLLQEISDELARTEQALALEADFPSLGLTTVNAALRAPGEHVDSARDAGVARRCRAGRQPGRPADPSSWPSASGPTLASLEAQAASSGEIAGEIALVEATTDR